MLINKMFLFKLLIKILKHSIYFCNEFSNLILSLKYCNNYYKVFLLLIVSDV